MKTSEALVPPKPKEFDKATSIAHSRGLLGTRSDTSNANCIPIDSSHMRLFDGLPDVYFIVSQNPADVASIMCAELFEPKPNSARAKKKLF